jgi:hypothetical protein
MSKVSLRSFQRLTLTMLKIERKALSSTQLRRKTWTAKASLVMMRRTRLRMQKSRWTRTTAQMSWVTLRWLELRARLRQTPQSDRFAVNKIGRSCLVTTKVMVHSRDTAVLTHVAATHAARSHANTDAKTRLRSNTLYTIHSQCIREAGLTVLEEAGGERCSE